MSNAGSGGKPERTLAALLQTLPQDLYDEIRDLTFTADTRPCHIYKLHKPPSSLQVSRTTREQFAKSYYGNSLFYMTEEDCCKWIASLQESHVRTLKEVRLLNMSIQASVTDSEAETNGALDRTFERLADYAFKLGRRHLYVSGYQTSDRMKLTSQYAHERIRLLPQVFKFKVVRGSQGTWQSI